MCEPSERAARGNCRGRGGGKGKGRSSGHIERESAGVRERIYTRTDRQADTQTGRQASRARELLANLRVTLKNSTVSGRAPSSSFAFLLVVGFHFRVVCANQFGALQSSFPIILVIDIMKLSKYSKKKTDI